MKCLVLLLVLVGVRAEAAEPAVVAGTPVHSAALIRRASDYSAGYVAGVNLTIERGFGGSRMLWKPLAQQLCGTAATVRTSGCSAGVYDATRWQTTRLTYDGPAEWLDRYDTAVTGREEDCGNGAAPGNDGCRAGKAARR